jgi:histidinol-phosphatase (PHP family)
VKIDYHTHHVRCGHALGSLRDMIEAAIQRGINQLGLSDHSPLYYLEEDHPIPNMAMAQREFPYYVAEMIQLREEYKDQIDVRLGVESDYVPGWENVYRAIYSNFPLDYIIGSVHHFGGYHIFNPERWKDPNIDVDSVYFEYFELIRRSAKSRLFDILGHIDALKGLGHRPTQSLGSQWDLTAEVIRDSGVAVEINTSGIRKCKEVFPCIELLERLSRFGVAFTFGSDAHKPEQLADHWDDMKELLMTLGVKELAVFKNRKRSMVPIL